MCMHDFFFTPVLNQPERSYFGLLKIPMHLYILTFLLFSLEEPEREREFRTEDEGGVVW